MKHGGQIVSFWRKMFGQSESAPSATSRSDEPSDGDGALFRAPDPADGERYLRLCSEPAFRDEREERSFQSDPTFQGVLGPLTLQQYPAAIAVAKRLPPRFPDLDLPYVWLGLAYRESGQLELSQQILAKGIVKAKRKCTLLRDMGQTKWQTGDIAAAVYWWCQAIHCRASSPTLLPDHLAYLLLAYVANGCDLSDAEHRLLDRVDAITAGRPRLMASMSDRLTALVRNSAYKSVISGAVQAIDAKYLRPSSDSQNQQNPYDPQNPYGQPGQPGQQYPYRQPPTDQPPEQ